MNRASTFVSALVPLLALPGCPPPSSPAGGPDGGSASTCQAPAGPGTKHAATVSGDETWAAADGPHVVTFGFKVQKGATLTLEPCAEVRLQRGHSIVVEGDLVAEGTAARPIRIGADDPASPWGSLQVYAPGTVRLAHATVSGGGAETSNAYGMIEARGDQERPAQPILQVDHVVVTGSASYGVSLREGAAFTAGSTALTITGSKIAPLRIVPRLASNLPDGAYVGNDSDVIVVETEAYGEVNYDDVTYHDRGVPYLIGADRSLGGLRVGPRHFTLTIEPGVVFGFKRGGYLAAEAGGGATGVIVARGPAERPIVLTSAADAPAPGDWVGVVIGAVADPAFRFDHAEISFAGGESGANGHHCYMGQQWRDDAAISIYHQPVARYVTSSLIAESKGDGINNAYTGDYYDFKASNTFKSVARCAVTQPLPRMGVCPSMGCP